jgi:hypothetical protein
MPDAADGRRTVESGANLVVHEPGAGGFEGVKNRRQLLVHLFRRQGPGRAGDAECRELAGRKALLRSWPIKKKHRCKAGFGKHRQRVGRSGEIVAVESHQRRLHVTTSNFDSAAASAGLLRACSDTGIPAATACHAARMLSTPAAGPPG